MPHGIGGSGGSWGVAAGSLNFLDYSIAISDFSLPRTRLTPIYSEILASLRPSGDRRRPFPTGVEWVW